MSFTIYRDTSPIDVDNLPVPIAENVEDKNYSDDDVTKGYTYYYRVSDGEGRLSDEVSVFAGTLWTPDILACQIYLDADDLSGTTISSWTDRKTGQAFTQSTVAFRPTLTTLNGKKALYFNGGYLAVTSGALLSASSSKEYLWSFAVMKRDVATPTLSANVFSFHSTANGYRYSLNAAMSQAGFWDKYASGGRWSDSAPFEFASSTTSSNLDAIDIVYGDMKPAESTATIAVNGTIEQTKTLSFGTGLTSSSNVDRVLVGRYEAATSSVKFTIACVLFGNTALSTEDRQKLEGWAAWKYDLVEKLPIDHPYKTHPPTL